jgi:hypothetical protein
MSSRWDSTPRRTDSLTVGRNVALTLTLNLLFYPLAKHLPVYAASHLKRNLHKGPQIPQNSDIIVATCKYPKPRSSALRGLRATGWRFQLQQIRSFF